MFGIYTEQRALQRRLSKRQKIPFRPLPDFAPSYEAIRDQYMAEFDADWFDWPYSEWSPHADLRRPAKVA